MMALPMRSPGEPHIRPELGDTLMVIHDFQARSSDELSLAKGDRVELIERDDEFGDGWFLGRHFVNGNTGLFPEVYTRPQPPPVPGSAFSAPKPLAPVVEASHEFSNIGPSLPLPLPPPPPPPQQTPERPPTPPTPKIDEPSVTLPLNAVKSEPIITRASADVGSSAAALGRLNNASQDSQVLNETLNVINEHITDLRSAPSSGGLRASGADSGSEYSIPLEHRMSYIQGEETDEEEDDSHTRSEVESWSPDEAAEYLFTAGVESHHCEVFRDQEISGEVLLGMDQSSLFIKAFDLGSVGRRLKTWHKIKALQEEVGDQGLETRRTTQTYGSDVAPEDGRRTRSRTNTLTNPSSSHRMSVQSRHLSMTQTPKDALAALTTPTSPPNVQGSPTRSGHTKRPSAASVRELHHSRRHSSTDFRTPPMMSSMTPKLATHMSGPNVAHKKQPSFDRNWTLGGAGTPQPPQRPLSSAGLQGLLGDSEQELQDSAVDLDRGYFSGTDTDAKRRNVLRKRDGEHTRKSSYAEEQRVRSATALSRHSRFGSVDSYRDGGPSPAVQKYYGVQSMPHRRTASTNTTESIRPVPPAKDGPSPTVTKLDGRPQPTPATSKHPGFNTDWLTSVVHKPKMGRPGMRAISEKLTIDRSKIRSPTEPLPNKGLSIDSPARTESSTPSVGPSFEIDSPDTTKSANSIMTPASKSNKRKGKKETSAYTRGLLKIPPKEAMVGADYYGWMKKKSSNLMTTWKPRLFVLKGRRLAYYYSEDDDQEKGLIDISFHRVLPADNEKLTGLHATITGAVGGTSMPTSHISDSVPLEKGDDSVFIFKLMPPRSGLSRAVNFTKPTVHYFAVPNLSQGRLWMAALMKATIDRDDTQPITSTYQQKTISLAKAKQMRHRPPALMNLEESTEEESNKPNQPNGGAPAAPAASNGLGIFAESDSGVSGVDKLGAQRVESAQLAGFGEEEEGIGGALPPQSA